MSSVAAIPPVLFVTKYYRPEIIGSGPYCGDIAEWLSGCQIPVSLLTARPHYPGNKVFTEYGSGARDVEVLGGVSVTRVPTWISGTGALHRLLADASFVAQGMLRLLGRRVRRHDVVLSLCPSILGVALGSLSTRRGGRHVVIVHDIESGLAGGLGILAGSGLIGLLRRLERAVLNRTSAVMVLSENMERQLRALGVRVPIRVLPIWIDTDEITPLERPPSDRFTLLYSGNFGRKQGLGQLLDLAALLRQRAPSARMVLRGGGGEAASLRAEVERRGLSNVQFQPLAPPDRFNEGLAEGDLHLVPQNPDGADFAVPSKIYGIMAAGRTFIATANPGGLLHSLEQRTGAFLCVPPNDPEAFAGAALRLIEDGGLRREMGQRGREYVVAHHAKHAVLQRLMDDLRHPD
jgi:colanic acid biosynthesis glycosyl transferase WcaI